MKRQISSMFTAFALLGAAPVLAAPITGGEIIFTPVLNFNDAGIKVDSFGGSYIDSHGRIHMPIVGGDLDKNDLSNADIKLASTAGINLSRTYTAGTGGQEVTGEINISDWSLFDYGKPVNSFHFKARESAALNTTRLKGVPIDATQLNPHDVQDPNVAPGNERKGKVTPISNLNPREQDLYLNGSVADGTAQQDGRFIVPEAQFHSNQTFGLAARSDPSQRLNDGYLNDTTYKLFTDSLSSNIYLEILEWYHLRINAQSVLGLSDAQASAVGFVDNASLFRVHAEGLTFGNVPVPAGYTFALVALGFFARARRKA